ncbi:hypothetical protein [Mammaliicoccus vitulinus]|uniref:hypothetical protein n=1 Tax=Mammaliicoccus vitulinus TaxID=71237 RepID=UPI00248B81ED|nr:hypothetical protein [Mammaliicoccus vitulinus]
MFITKQELKKINVKEVFETGANFIKITDGRHTIYQVNDKYKVIDYKDGMGLSEAKKVPKYIKQALV